MNNEIKNLEDFQSKLNKQLVNEPRSKLIKKSGDLINQLRQLNTIPASTFISSNVQIDFPSEIVPEYACSEFKLKHFSQRRYQEEPIYSPPFFANGITWRLMVYPNGNGNQA